MAARELCLCLTKRNARVRKIIEETLQRQSILWLIYSNGEAERQAQCSEKKIEVGIIINIA